MWASEDSMHTGDILVGDIGDIRGKHDIQMYVLCSEAKHGLPCLCMEHDQLLNGLLVTLKREDNNLLTILLIKWTPSSTLLYQSTAVEKP